VTDGKVLLGVYGLSHRFGSHTALSEVSLEVQPGKVVALIGANGCGKSTLLKLASGVIRRQEGVIKMGASEIHDLKPAERAARVTYVGAGVRPEFPLTAAQAAGLGAVARGLADPARVQSAMEACGCWGLRDRQLSSLSGGERQLVTLARALVQGGRVLLLDESLSGMDLHHQARAGALIRRLAREEGYGVVLVAHDLNLASEWADEAILLAAGKVVASGPLAQTLTAEKLAQLYPGAALTVSASPSSGAPKVFFAGLR
jgi:iron complex transport system ATP-binding protein